MTIRQSKIIVRTPDKMEMKLTGLKNLVQSMQDYMIFNNLLLRNHLQYVDPILMLLCLIGGGIISQSLKVFISTMQEKRKPIMWDCAMMIFLYPLMPQIAYYGPFLSVSIQWRHFPSTVFQDGCLSLRFGVPGRRMERSRRTG